MKKSIEYFQKIKDTPRGRAVLFFAFYFFFFLVLIIFIRSSNHQYFNNHEYEKGNDNYVSFDGLKKKNYSFTYSIIVDGKEYLYSGKKYSNRELFTFNNHDYYSDSREYYVKDIDWKKSENPYVFFNFINVIGGYAFFFLHIPKGFCSCNNLLIGHPGFILRHNNGTQNSRNQYADTKTPHIGFSLHIYPSFTYTPYKSMTSFTSPCPMPSSLEISRMDFPFLCNSKICSFGMS